MTDLYTPNYIDILQKTTIDDINSRITVIKHGIFLFMQYTEKRHIQYNLPEPLFWELIGKLYCLLHDCQNNIFRLLISSDATYIQKRRYIFGDLLSSINIGEITDFIEYVSKMRIVKYQNMNMSDRFDSDRVEDVKCKLSEIAGVEGALKKDEDWEKCVLWIHANCNLLYDFLQKVLGYIENSSNAEQRKCLCQEYSSAVEQYLNGTNGKMRGIFRNILLFKHRKNEEVARAYINKYKKDVTNLTVKIIENSSVLVNPYEIAYQTADVFLEEKLKEC